MKKLTNSALYESSLQPSFIFYDFLIFDLPKRVKKISREGECADFSDLKSQFFPPLRKYIAPLFEPIIKQTFTT